MKPTISNSLIIISLIFTLVSFQNDEIFNFGMNSYYLIEGKYIEFFLQICFYSFLHGGIMHLLFNSVFLYIFGNQVEESIGKKYYLIFFIGATLFNALALLLLSHGTTVGISGFGMALLSFYTLQLHHRGDSEYKGGITAIIINILIGLSGPISLVGHLFGAIFGGIFYLFLKTIKRS